MIFKYQCECMDDNCRTVIIGTDNRLDGIRCPRCGGPVNVNPFENKKHNASDRALFVRDKILERNLKHCKNITPEQMDTVLSIGDEYQDNKSDVEDIKCTVTIDGKEIARLVAEHIKRDEQRRWKFNA